MSDRKLKGLVYEIQKLREELTAANARADGLQKSIGTYTKAWHEAEDALVIQAARADAAVGVWSLLSEDTELPDEYLMAYRVAGVWVRDYSCLHLDNDDLDTYWRPLCSADTPPEDKP